MIETTLVLLKPDCLAARRCGEVITRFEAAGLEIAGCKMMLLADDLLAEHYAHVSDRPFYPELKSDLPILAKQQRERSAAILEKTPCSIWSMALIVLRMHLQS